MYTEPSIYKLKNGKYQLSFINPESKKRTRHKYDYFVDAEKDRINFITQYKRPIYTMGLSGATISELMDYYKECCPDTKLNFQKYIIEEFLKSFGEMRAHDLDPVVLKKFLLEHQAKKDVMDSTLKE